MPVGRLGPPPTVAAWRHHTAREATEVVTLRAHDGGWLLTGEVVGVENATPWAFSWEVEVDRSWATRRAAVASRLGNGTTEVRLFRDGHGWRVDGRDRPDLADVVDVDLECSAVTNTLPLHRLRLDDRAAVPAAYVRLDLSVRRLDQGYGPARASAEGGWIVGYEAPEFAVACDLAYDAAGLVVDYPGLASRLL